MGQTWGSWSTAFMQALSAPLTDSNYACLYAIIDKEHTTCAWNPLSVTGEGTPCQGNPSGVSAFPTFGDGLVGTIRFLSAVGAQDYPGRILNPLRAGNGLQALHGFDATGAWAGDFPAAYDLYNTFIQDPKPGGGYGASPLPADPQAGEGNIGNIQNISGNIGPVSLPSLSDIYNSVKDLINAFGAVANFFGELLKRTTWVRIGQIIGGVLLIGFAIGIANKDIYGKNPVLNAAKAVARL